MQLPDFGDIRIAAFYGFALLVLSTAMMLGGKPERLGIFVILSVFVIQTTLFSLFGAKQFDVVDWVSVVADIWIALGIGLIALNANRIWPIPAASMALISLASHWARHQTDMLPFSYAQYSVVPTAMILLLILIGTLSHRLKVRKNGQYPDWVPFKEYAYFRRIASRAEL